MKTEVYSWRVSRELKSGLEREARRRKLSLSAVLDLAAIEWLNRTEPESGSDAEQHRLHASAAKAFGSIAGGDPSRSVNVRKAVRERLRRQSDR
jgi:hypothetical protein